MDEQKQAGCCSRRELLSTGPRLVFQRATRLTGCSANYFTSRIAFATASDNTALTEVRHVATVCGETLGEVVPHDDVLSFRRSAFGGQLSALVAAKLVRLRRTRPVGRRGRSFGAAYTLNTNSTKE